MKIWSVKLYGIQWDDSKGEYDTSDLPDNLECTVEAETKRDAIERALLDVSDQVGFLVEGTEQIDTQQIGTLV